MLSSFFILSRQQAFQFSRHASTSTINAKNVFQTRSRLYQNLYPWRTEIELAKLLVSNVVYNDHGLVALVKPTGLGLHKPAFVTNSLKLKASKADQLFVSKLIGEPKFCVAQVLDYIAQMLNLSSLKITKTVHRNYSGLILLTTNTQTEQKVIKAIRRARILVTPYMRYHVIVQGIIPGNIDQGSITERCGIRLIEIDELGDVKQPVYVPPHELTRRMIRKGTRFSDPNKVKPAMIRYRTLATNRDLAVSLIELETNITKWSLVECFLAYKTAFVLGDTYFSQRVKHILGQPVTIKPTKIIGQKARVIDPSFEPLSEQVRKVLRVRGNADIPLMIHHDGLILPGLKKELSPKKQGDPKSKSSENTEVEQFEHQKSKTNDEDLIINVDSLTHLPSYFVDTLDRLKLNVFS